MIFDGKEFAYRKKSELKRRVETMRKKPSMVSVLVGENSESELYTRMKQSVAEQIGVEFRVERIGGDVKLEELKKRVRDLGESEIDGLMIQLPLPDRLDIHTEDVLAEIPISKDVDGLRWRESKRMPATTRAVISILDEMGMRAGDVWQGKFVVVGYTGNVGSPTAFFLENRNVEVIGINTKTDNPQEILENADVIVSCAGVPGVVADGKYKAGVVIVDVGIEMVDGEVVGDVDKELYEKARVIVPVPGGVGPVTVVSLIENLIELTNSVL